MKYFGTDGIRGIPNEKLSIELLTRLGMALKCLGCNDVVIATDTRVSKDMLSCAIASGCLSRGINVHLGGILPTPALVYYSLKKKVVGVMITASHNPYYDNGIKIIKNGYKLSKEDELKIESLIDNPEAYCNEIGQLTFENSIKEEYLNFILKNAVKSNLSVCLDCANGSVSTTAKLVFSKITNTLVVCADEPDGYNINNGVGSTHLDFLKHKVLENKCDIGFAFDGDGDRVLCVNKDGSSVDGDQIICVIAKYLKQINLLKHNKIVLSIMSNLGLISNLKENRIDVLETPVGDKYVTEALAANDLSIGGENSGHIIVNDIFHSGDGVLVAVLLMKILSDTNTELSDWLKDIQMYEDKMINIKVSNKQKVLENKGLYERIEKIKEELNGDCKIIVRPSGTEEVIRVSVMARSKELVNKYVEELVHLVKESL